MLTFSLWERASEGVGAEVEESDDSDVHGVRALKGVGSMRPAEFSTRMIFLREVMLGDSRLGELRSGTRL